MSNNAVFLWPGMFTFDSGVVTFGSNVTVGLLLPASDYINFGTTSGTSGYGFRDNTGVMEYKNSGGAWNAFPTGGSAPDDATYITQTPNAGLDNEQALSALTTGVLLSTTTTGVVSSLGVGTVAQALIGGTTPAFGNLITVAALATTSTDGWVLSNTTAATGGATVQISPRLRLRGNAWDTAASKTVDFFLENLPATAATPTGTLKFGYSLNGAAATYPMTVTSAGTLAVNIAAAAQYSRVGSVDVGTESSALLSFFTNNVTRWTIAAASGALSGATTTSAIAQYKAVATAGWGVPAIYGYGDVAAATNVGTASIATYTVGAADGTFEVGANCLVTTSTNHSFSLDVTYTDESNSALTMVLPVTVLAGTFATTGLITNITGVGPYSAPVMTIRCKAATVITVRTSAGGTFTTVVYNARGSIKQIS